MGTGTTSTTFTKRLRVAVPVLTAALLTTGVFTHQQIRRADRAEATAHDLQAGVQQEKENDTFNRQEVMELEWELYKVRADAKE